MPMRILAIDGDPRALELLTACLVAPVTSAAFA